MTLSEQVASKDGGWTPGPIAVHRQAGECAISGFHHLTEAGKDRPAIAYVISREDARLFAAASEMFAALVAAKQALWIEARSGWALADFKNWAVVQQIDAALDKADGKARAALSRAQGEQP